MAERQQAAAAVGGDMMDVASAPSQPQTPTAKDDMIGCVGALEAALLPCLPARELQAIDRSPHPSHQSVERADKLEKKMKMAASFTYESMTAEGIEPIVAILYDQDGTLFIQFDVERHARDFMEAAKKLQLHFVGLLREDQPSQSDVLRKDIAAMEEELKAKTELIKTQEQLIQGWIKQLKEQLDRHRTELSKV